jgi:pyridoxal phosphate enzyme (YggS family)
VGSLSSRWEEVLARVDRACSACGRDPASVTIIAVSKNHSAADAKLFYDLGHRVFGESRLQEAIPKLELLPDDIDWHFIGKLQSNKAKKAGGLFRTIHSIESEKLLREVSKAGKSTDVFLQVNIGEESQKSGLFEKDLDAALVNAAQYENIRVRGLMTIGPQFANPDDNRPIFRRLAALSEQHGLKDLSMGMSSDFEVAIQEGATHVRIGSAIFGPRAI